MEKPKRPKPEWVNAKQAAAFAGISQRSLFNWSIQPVAQIGRTNYYQASDVAEAVIARERKRHEKDAPPPGDNFADDPSQVKIELDKKRIRLTEAQAVQQEMKNEMMRHEVAPFAFITFVLGRTSNAIAGVMDSLPVDLMRKLGLKPQDVEKVKVVTAGAADSIASLGDESWLAARYDEFLAEADQ